MPISFQEYLSAQLTQEIKYASGTFWKTADIIGILVYPSKNALRTPAHADSLESVNAEENLPLAMGKLLVRTKEMQRHREKDGLGTGREKTG